MALKGHAKIQLFDAKTGELTDEVENDNLVTNAVKDVVASIVRDWINWPDNNGRPFTTGLVRENGNNVKYNDFIVNFFGGVLVFNSKLPESASHTFPIKDEMLAIIGHAGHGSADTSDVSAGSFNISESTIDIKNKKYQFVWDFGTSAANGDIACICLTSAACGQAGYFQEGAFNQKNCSQMFIDKYPFAPYTKLYNPLSKGDDHYAGVELDALGIGTQLRSYKDVDYNISDYISGYNQLRPRDHKGYYWRIYRKETNGVFDFRCFDYDRKTYHDFSVDTNLFVDSLKAMDSSWDSIMKYSLYIDDETMTIYVGRSSEAIFPNVYVGKIQASDGSFITNTITMPDDYTGQKGDEVIFNNVNGMISVQVCYIQYGASATYGKSTQSLLDDRLDIVKNYCMYNFEPQDFSRIPNVLRDCHGYKSKWDDIIYDMYYLATINNQDEVLQKTSDKTMKIIYTLTEE